VTLKSAQRGNYPGCFHWRTPQPGYCQAAQRDERNGFPFTAAMEWRKAADLFSPIVPFVELCWRNWERITCLPRHLAEPIIDQLQLDARTSQGSVPLLAATEPSFLQSA
jgi:hypothetical protein